MFKFDFLSLRSIVVALGLILLIMASENSYAQRPVSGKEKPRITSRTTATIQSYKYYDLKQRLESEPFRSELSAESKDWLLRLEYVNDKPQIDMYLNKLEILLKLLRENRHCAAQYLSGAGGVRIQDLSPPSTGDPCARNSRLLRKDIGELVSKTSREIDRNSRLPGFSDLLPYAFFFVILPISLVVWFMIRERKTK